jgi:hypothetical protein
MAGLRRIAKMHGGIVINGQRWSWDYAADEPVLASDMPEGGERWKASERARWKHLSASPTPEI